MINKPVSRNTPPSPNRIVCGCGKGYASHVDGRCCFCREKAFRRAEAKKVGVKYRGQGMTLDQMGKLKS